MSDYYWCRTSFKIEMDWLEGFVKAQKNYDKGNK